MQDFVLVGKWPNLTASSFRSQEDVTLVLWRHAVFSMSCSSVIISFLRRNSSSFHYVDWNMSSRPNVNIFEINGQHFHPIRFHSRASAADWHGRCSQRPRIKTHEDFQDLSPRGNNVAVTVLPVRVNVWTLSKCSRSVNRLSFHMKGDIGAFREARHAKGT